ncbi:MAG: glucuronate isomerase [Bacilli bacterium]|nr:glucuronate isomerase [Bacilli bacterium]
MSYIKKNFLLSNKVSEELYFKYAQKMPIFDYHCHISEKEILEDKPFNNIYEMWLSGDHYKWRLMRNAGVNEEFITGKASPKEKFLAYCEALGTAYLNPLTHWSQLELKAYFNCDIEINKANALKIWNHCNDYLKKHKITRSSLIKNSNVKYIFTTNEAWDDLTIFTKINKKYKEFKVYPAFRTDKFLNIEAKLFKDYIKKLGNISSLDELLKTLESKLKAFVKVGCTASDMGVENVYPVSSKAIASKLFAKRMKGECISISEAKQYKGYMVYALLKMYHKYHIRSELHYGAMRNNSTKMFNKLGLDTGYDSIAENNSIYNLSRLMDRLDLENSLPPMIIFNLNPAANLEIMSLINCFQDDSYRGKIQYGPAWWFLDNKEGMIKHLKDLTAVGHLGVFVGMLTDSRSFLSYTRHHYFRRILCDYLGKAIVNGEMTDDIKSIGKVIEDISFNNSVKYFGLKK